MLLVGIKGLQNLSHVAEYPLAVCMKVHWDANPTVAGVGFLSGLANLSLILCRHLHPGLK